MQNTKRNLKNGGKEPRYSSSSNEDEDEDERGAQHESLLKNVLKVEQSCKETLFKIEKLENLYLPVSYRICALRLDTDYPSNFIYMLQFYRFTLLFSLPTGSKVLIYTLCIKSTDTISTLLLSYSLQDSSLPPSHLPFVGNSLTDMAGDWLAASFASSTPYLA